MSRIICMLSAAVVRRRKRNGKKELVKQTER